MGETDWRTTYEDLLLRYLPALRRLARSYVRDPGEQEDLLQEIALGFPGNIPPASKSKKAHGSHISNPMRRPRQALGYSATLA